MSLASFGPLSLSHPRRLRSTVCSYELSLRCPCSSCFSLRSSLHCHLLRLPKDSIMLSIASPRAIALLSFLSLTISSHIHADTVVQDPMQASANSFGWLAIRNFTYCLSDRPDPPDKPRGVQPKTNTAPSLSGSTAQTQRLTGMGDSVVVLYHPEQTNKAIAWCNTLVAMQSGKNVKCHIALPTCQRCDAVRSPTTTPLKPQEEREMGSKAPSGRLGEKRTAASPLVPAGGAADKQLVALRRRASTGKTDPNDPLIPPPQSYEKTIGKPFGRGDEYPFDPELEPAIAEFQDYCENKLTLAVRADCPFHLVKGWSDEPPFDLHRFCMSLMGNDGHTLHTEGGGGKPAPLKVIGNGARVGGEGGILDPNDPIVPSRDGSPAPLQQPRPVEPAGVWST